ncbi:hypothetical protein [Bradyrhizobium sp. JR4.1]|uniref:hypothetical protein n=1 Tax=Bradyrhizobium sp. JR4.1 TaxID=3156372 RepID=UPI00339AE22B
MPDTPLPIDPRVEAEALFNKEGLVLLRKSDEEDRHEGQQNKALRDVTGLVWRQYMLGAFDRLVADRRVKIYARAGSATDPLRRLPSDLWPRLEVLDWQHGVAGDPEGTMYYSVHASGSSPAASPKQKAIAADEKSAIEALAKQLKLNHDMTSAEALSFCKSSQFRIGRRGFEHHVWPEARDKAGLSRKAPAGRKKKSPR